jgi:hypothetical protein
VFVITRVSSGRCGAVSIDLDELITEHYGITRAEVAPELESLPSIRPQAAAPSSTPSPTTLQRFSRDAPQTRLVGAGCGRSHPAAQPTKLVETGVGTPSPARHVVAHSSVLGRMRIAVRSESLAGSASATRLPAQHTTLGQLAHHLFGEERITSGPLGDRVAQPDNRGVRPEQF